MPLAVRVGGSRSCSHR